MKNDIELVPANFGSPVVALRRAASLNQRDFARLLNLNTQTLYQAECGQFPELPNIIVEAAFKFYPNPASFRKEYRSFVKSKRLAFAESLKVAGVAWQVGDDATQPPVGCLSVCTGLSLSQFCKQAAIQPSTIYHLKNGKRRTLGSQMESALREIEAGFPKSATFIAELNDRQEEFYFYITS